MHGDPNNDDRHSRAIAQEIGQRLQVYLRMDTELPSIIKTRLARLRDVDEQSPSIVPEPEPEVESEGTKAGASGSNQSRFGWPWQRGIDRST
jgi:hypothetical protein